jgi:hypothetical protein
VRSGTSVPNRSSMQGQEGMLVMLHSWTTHELRHYRKSADCRFYHALKPRSESHEKSLVSVVPWVRDFRSPTTCISVPLPSRTVYASLHVGQVAVGPFCYSDCILYCEIPDNVTRSLHAFEACNQKPSRI